jgi:hypothetical protein
VRPLLPLATLADASEVAGIVGAAVAVFGLAFVWFQLRAGAAAARAQATIQFQAAFRESRAARGWLVQAFPVHESLLGAFDPGTEHEVRVWSDVDDLTDDDRRNAQAVIGALNDVAQYVADGLSLRSALQQYHTWFVLAGWLLNPYIGLRNAPNATSGHRPARYGLRVPLLYNAGLAYHRGNPKHQETELILRRPSVRVGGGEVRLLLVRSDGSGVSEHRGGSGDRSLPRLWSLRRWSLTFVIRHAERRLRR